MNKKNCRHDVTIVIKVNGKNIRRCLGCGKEFTTLSSLNSGRKQINNKLKESDKNA